MIGPLLAWGGAIGLGVALLVRGLAPPMLPLAVALDRRHNGAFLEPAPVEGGWSARAGRPAVRLFASFGLPTARVRRDLAALERPAAAHLAEQATSAVIAALIPALMAAVFTLAGVSVPIAVPLWACLLLGVAGFLVPDLAARSEATRRRAEFSHALGGFLDLMVIALAGGAGVEGALTEASRVGQGWAFERLRRALEVAAMTRVSPWTVLGRLGEDLGVPALRELSAAVELAGTEGAKVRMSLAAKASALRMREIADAEAGALAATERMSLPVVVMFTGFLIFIGYPAMVNVLLHL